MKVRSSHLVRAIAFTLLGCSTPANEELERDLPVTVRYNAQPGYQSYFPGTDLDSWLTSYYIGSLDQMHEPAIGDARVPQGSVVMRLVVLPSFHPMVAVRFQLDREGCGAVVTEQELPVTEWSEADSMGIFSNTGWHPGALRRRDSTAVSISTCRIIREKLIALGLWEQMPIDNSDGLDGTDWLLEAVDASGYHLIRRRSESPAMKEAVDAILAAVQQRAGGRYGSL